ncbi:MAG: ABC transporter permease [Gemmatimonadetes bacterium]|nr:ABC transporter permease [Gemmatimonadota bacterium]
MRHARPPARAERLLLLVLGDTPEGRSVVGDLNEDHVRLVARRGRLRADLWYLREALGMAAGVMLRRMIPGRDTNGGTKGRRTMDGSGVRGWVQDVRYAIRAIGRDVSYLLFAATIIGLGVGASTAVYSVVRPLLLAPLPFERPDELVWVARAEGAGDRSLVTSRTSNLRDFRELNRSFDGLAGYNAFFDQSSYNLQGAGEPERLVGVGVTDDFLDVLGVEPAVGRDFSPEEGQWGGPPAVILSHGYWVQKFASDPSVVGTTLTLNDQPREVVGVLPPSFDFSSVFTPGVSVDFLLPWSVGDETDRWGNTTSMVGRLAPGVTVEQAQADLDNIVTGLRAADPDRWGLDATVSGLQEQIGRPFRTALLLLTAAAAAVMLIVCVNLSNMLLARSPRRRKEMAVRRTMGATTGRLTRQLLLESVAVAMCGAVVGLILAYGAIRFVTGTGAVNLPLVEAISVDGWALAFSIGAALLTGLAVGVLPAMQVVDGGEAEALAGSSRGSSAGRSTTRLRELLVVSEVAMACVLLVLGGLVLKSFQQVMEVDLGYEAEGALAWQLSAADDGEGAEPFEDIVREVLAVPGVEAVGLTDALPLGRNRGWGTRIEGVDYDDDESAGFFPHLVDHRYLDAMGIPLVKGRQFTSDDTDESALVALVNESAERMYFPGGEAVGHFFDMWPGRIEVVGVVADVRHRGLDLEPGPEFYFHISQLPDFQSLDMVVRTRLPAATIAGPIGRAIRTADPRMPIDDFWTLESVVDRSVSPRRFTVQLLGAFGLTALLLAGLGIYGVLSYSVAERGAEIGIRMALGETSGGVLQSLVGRTVLLALTGVGLGIATALLATRMVSSILFGVEPTDPATFATIVGALLGVAGLAGLIPALRAARTDSAAVLRSAQ